MEVAKEEGGGAGFDEVGGLLGVESLEPSENEIIGFYYLGLIRVVGVSGHGWVYLIEMFDSFDRVFGLLFHLNKFKL